MHYHLASSYYSFFFLYIYIFHGFPIYTRTNKTHTFQVWWIFQKKKKCSFLRIYVCVYAYVCTYTRVQQHEENVLGIHISSLSRVLNFLNFSLYSSPSSSFFFLPLRLLLHCRLVLLLFSEVCYYYIVKCPTDQLQWATIIYKSC